MQLKNNLIGWWLTTNLPRQHWIVQRSEKSAGKAVRLRLYIRKWLIHPVKRRVAKYYLIFLRYFFNLKVIAITGSAGKTSTKDMTASILSQAGVTIKSYKNIDPVYNIPTTILKCNQWTKYLVLEYGVEFPGEMDFYLWLAVPDIAVVTNIYPTHTEFFKNVNGVASEKLKLITKLGKGRTAVLNLASREIKEGVNKLSGRKVWYGSKGMIRALNSKINDNMKTYYTLSTPKGKISIRISCIGEQFIENSLAASAVSYVLGLDLSIIKKGLGKYSPPEHRMTVKKLRIGATLLDDSYNNNPEAAKEAVRTLQMIAGESPKIIVFGDMLELGEKENYYHRKLGEIIAKSGVKFFIGVGSLAKYTHNIVRKRIGRSNSAWVETEGEVDKKLEEYIKPGVFILVKGSRAVGLDRLCDRLS